MKPRNSMVFGVVVVVLAIAIGLLVATWANASEAVKICVPKGFEWLANADVTPARMLQHPETGAPAVLGYGEHDGSPFIVIADAESAELIWFDPTPQNNDAPGYERGKDCTWRRRHEAKDFAGEFEDGVIITRSTSL